MVKFEQCRYGCICSTSLNWVKTFFSYCCHLVIQKQQTFHKDTPKTFKLILVSKKFVSSASSWFHSFIFFKGNHESSEKEWSFYPSSCNRTYHSGKKCIFNGVHLRTRTSSSEWTLEMSIGKKKYGKTPDFIFKFVILNFSVLKALWKLITLEVGVNCCINYWSRCC